MSGAYSKPEFVGVTTKPEDLRVDMLFVPVFLGDDPLDDLHGIDAATGGQISRARSSGEFKGRGHELFMASIVGGGWKAGRVALVGAAKRADASVDGLRRLGASCGYTALLRSIKTIGVVVRAELGLDQVAVAQAVADGLCSAEFDGAAYRSKNDSANVYPRELVICAPGLQGREEELTRAVARGRTIGDCANRTRALANEPGNLLTPRVFADRVSEMCTDVGLTVEVLDEDRIRELKMGLLLGVAAGSVEPPRLMVIRHEPPGAPEKPVLGLVGKGVTFDSGGISIKPAEMMDRMKDDMAGGAAVAGAMRAIALLNVNCRVIGMIPATENMPDGRATRPGDVLVGASGKTVEIINTDAEGRLILGDALWYMQQLGATHMVDVATLTGACMIALGKTASGLFGKPDSWVEHVRAAGARAGDRLWPLPLFDEYREQLRSEIADIVNSAGRAAGAITAAWFLKEFVDSRPWAHLDIAGTAWSEERKPYQPKGATGVAVRTLIELAETLTGTSGTPGTAGT